MKYEELEGFIENTMRMSHHYQPTMLLALLKNGGTCHEERIASDLLAHDRSQIEYYTKITNNMVGKVLRNHEIVQRDKATREYTLVGFDTFSEDQVQKLIGLCDKRQSLFFEARGKQIFDHRRKSSGYVSGTIKYGVLKRAGFHCELCGIRADEKALEVDHIIPRNRGGSDDESNFQALCYSCNAMKRDRDDTDFRKVRASYDNRQKGCQFCEAPNERIIEENELVYVIRDAFPVTELHSLIIPKRHVATYFELGQAEVNACNRLVASAKETIEQQDDAVSGFNIGMNIGESSGQTIFHCHIHLIPRREGDVENPRGGVRHVIPEKGDY